MRKTAQIFVGMAVTNDSLKCVFR